MRHFYRVAACLLISATAFGQSYSGGMPIPGLPKSVGPKLMSGSTSVTFATDQPPIVLAGQITATVSSVNASVGSFGAALPISGTAIGWKDSSGNLQPFLGSSQGITVSANQSTSPWVVSGSVTAARSWVLQGSVDSVGVTGTVTSNQGTSPWVVSGSVTASRNWVLQGSVDSVGVTGTVQSKAPLNAAASFASANISTTTTATAPSNAVEVMVEAPDTNTANLRVAFGATASASNGWQLQPGRSEIFHVNANASVCPESGTQGYIIQWISQ